MIRFRSIATVLAVITLAVCAHAQGTNGGVLYASDFANWSLPTGTTPIQGGAAWPNPEICRVPSNGRTFAALKVGRKVTILDGANTETVTPSSVVVNNNICQFTATMTHQHYSYQIRSATAGLQEAIDYNSSLGTGAVIILTPVWGSLGGTTAMITGASGSNGTYILDQRTLPATSYLWSGSAYVASTVGTGTITGVTAGTGVTGGGSSGSVPVAIDTTVVPTLSNANAFTNTNTFTTLVGKTLAGSRYATQWGNGSTNGISSAAAISQFVTADPSYPTTEQYSPASPIQNWPSQFTFQDLRVGHNLTLLHNPQPNFALYGDGAYPDAMVYSQHDGVYAWQNDGWQYAQKVFLNSTTPGGNLDFNSAGGVGWQLSSALAVQQNVSGGGIAEAFGCQQYKTGEGDSVCAYFYLNDSGSPYSGKSDESKKSIAATTNEWQAVYTGACTSGCTASTRQVKTTCQSSTNSCAVGSTPSAAGVGHPLIDTTAGSIASTITNISNSALSSSAMSAVTLGTTVPVSNGWGTLQADIATPNNQTCYYSASALTSVASGTGVYTGTITNGASNALAGCAVQIIGFGNSANNGSFTVSASTATTIIVNNSSSVSQTGSAVSMVYPFATIESFAVTLTGGTVFDSTHELCMTGWFHECIVPISATNTSGANWQIVAALRRAQPSGSYVFQGGLAGYGMEVTAYTLANNGITYRFLFDVVGSTAANTLQVLRWDQGRPKNLSTVPNFNVNNSLYGCYNASLANSGTTTVTATFSSYCTASFGSIPDYTGATFYISGASDSTFNGNCTGVAWSGSTMTCTESGLSGTHTAATAQIQLSATGHNGLNSVNLWPMSYVSDVQDYSTTPASVDGTLTIDPNPNLVIATNDVLEEPHAADNLFNGMTLNNLPILPYATEHALQINMGGQFGTTGPQGGGLGVTTNSVLSMAAGFPDSLYKGLGGYFIPPNMINAQGAYYIGADYNEGPALNQPWLALQYTAAQRADASYCHYIWQTYPASGNAFTQFCPNSGNVVMGNTTPSGTTKITSTGAITVDSPAGVTLGASGHTTTISGPVVLPNSGATAGTYVLPTMTVTAGGLITAISNNTATAQQLSQVASGGMENYVENSTTMSGTGWSTSGSPVVTTGQAGPFTGTMGVSIATTVATDYYINSGATVTNAGTYTACGWMKGALGTERENVTIGGSGPITGAVPTAWTYYSLPITAGGATSQTLRFSQGTGTAQTVYVYGWNVVPSTVTCVSPGIPTGNNTVTTLTSEVVTPIVAINGTQTTVNCSTSGTAVFSQPEQGVSDKKVLIHLAACNGTASYTYPTAFTNTPSVYASNNVAAAIATAVSSTAVTVTGAPSTGSLVLEDY